MGLSILIPIYNVDVTALVKTLSEQLHKSGQQGEIILLDDFSDLSFHSVNHLLNDLFLVKYHRNEKNEGRMTSRIKLASLASSENLLFIDCDSKIIHENFVAKYLEKENEADVMVGGRVYSSTLPDCKYRLNWKYGGRRENRRQAAFMSNNFMIKKKIFEKLDFSFQLQGYGHEDTWWGIQFKKMGSKIKMINDPVLHDVLEDSETFLKKSENALANLLILEKKIGSKELKKEVKIYRWYRRLRSFGLTGLYLFKERFFHKRFHKNLISCHPRLFYFDLYRLALLIHISRKNHS